MSLNALSRYDDAEDEIRDEDHNLVIERENLGRENETRTSDTESSRPPSAQSKRKGLVSYIGDYSDDEISSSEENDDTEKDDTPSKGSVVNFGLYEGSNVISSTGSASPSSVNDTLDMVEHQQKETSDGIKLPPEPEGRCSKMLQEKITRMIEKKNSGMNVNDYVQRKKEFRNPSIYEKLVTFIGIDEHGTNFPKHLYDPSIWGPECYYDELAKAQKEHHDKKEKEKLKEKRAQVEFVTATKKGVLAQNTASSEKRSKWDQKVPPFVQAAIKTNEEK